MDDTLGTIIMFFLLYLSPIWVTEFTDILAVFWGLAAAQLAIIVLAALLPVQSRPKAGRVAPRLGRATLTTEVERLAQGRPRTIGRSVLLVLLTVVTIGAVNLALLTVLVPICLFEAAGLLPICLLLAAVNVALIVLSALRPVSWPSRAGRILLTVVAIAAFNFVLNRIWPPMLD